MFRVPAFECVRVCVRAHLGQRRRWLASALAALVAAAVAADVSAGATSAGNLARAQSEAARLLGLLKLPSGAIASAREPSGDNRLHAVPVILR